MFERSEQLSEITLNPVGIVRSNFRDPSLVAESGDLTWQDRANRANEHRSSVSEIVVNEDVAEALEGIEEFSHILVLFWAHRVPPEGRSLTRAHPMGRKDLPVVGIFATCSPARPNSICATVARLLERERNLRVEGLDAIDGSPVVDIKAYNPGYFANHDVKVAPWMEQIHRELAEATFSSSEAEGT